MKFTLILASLGVSISLIGCGQPSSPNTHYTALNRSEPTSESTFALSHYPERLARNVPTNAAIELRFSRPVAWSSVNFTNFRVLDEFNQVVTGEISSHNGGSALRFQPKIGGENAVLRAASTYRVNARFLRDTENQFIPAVSWQFQTEGSQANSGAFRIVRQLPTGSQIRPGDRIAVEFNESIAAPPSMNPNQAFCSYTYFASAFQVGILQPLNNQGDTRFVALDGEVCAKRINGQLRILEFEPNKGLTASLIPQYLVVRVSDSPQLRGINSQQSIGRQVQYQRVLLPQPNDILSFLFGQWPPAP
ncbi:MAG: hypothetical protein EA369_04110 [Bradymonadales bacterium]|nr:MAG: hypothetical protein EA369_04110 [Bradymonadales bacterium]